MRVTELCGREMGEKEERRGWEIETGTAAAGGRLGSFGTNNNYNNNSGSGVGVGVGDEGKYVVHAPTIITTITVTT